MPIHIKAKPEDIAPIVFLPGDPDRAREMAENFMEDAHCYNTYRQLLGYTGTWKGMRYSIQTTGMGGPSAAIVCEELAQLGAKFFIRIGTCGSMDPAVEIGDIIIVSAACPLDNTSNEIFGRKGFAPTSDFYFIRNAYEMALQHKYKAHVGPIASLDRFYGHDDTFYEHLRSFGVLAVEMEAATVLTMAPTKGIKAACLLMVSDILDGQKRASDEGIWEGVRRMVEISLLGIQGLAP